MYSARGHANRVTLKITASHARQAIGEQFVSIPVTTVQAAVKLVVVQVVILATIGFIAIH